MAATDQPIIGDVYEYDPYPLVGDPEPTPCRYCGRDTILTFGHWMDGTGRYRCPSDWTEHAPLPGHAARIWNGSAYVLETDRSAA